VNSSGRYGPSTARLPDTSRSQGKVGRYVDSEPSSGKQETAHAPPPTSAGTHSTQDQPKPVIGAPANNSSPVSAVGLLSRRPSVAGDWRSSFISPGSHYEPSSMPAPRNSPEALTKRETGPVPAVMSPSTNPAGTQSTSPSTHSLRGEGGGTSVRKTDATGLVQPSGNKSSILSSSTLYLLTHSPLSPTAPLPLTKETSPSSIDKPKGRVTGETEALPEALVRDVLRSPDEYKGIVSPNADEPVSTGGSRELEGLLPSSGHTKTTAMPPPHNSPIAFRSVHSTSYGFSPILQPGDMLKQVATTNSKIRPTIPSHNPTSSPLATRTSRSSSRSSRMDIQTKAGDETTKTPSYHLQTSQPQANPALQPSEAYTQLSPLERNGRRTDSGQPEPPGGEPPKPPDGVPPEPSDGPPNLPFAGKPKSAEKPKPPTGPSNRQGCCSCFLFWGRPPPPPDGEPPPPLRGGPPEPPGGGLPESPGGGPPKPPGGPPGSPGGGPSNRQGYRSCFLFWGRPPPPPRGGPSNRQGCRSCFLFWGRPPPPPRGGPPNWQGYCSRFLSCFKCCI
jgi:hypothetical protein